MKTEDVPRAGSSAARSAGSSIWRNLPVVALAVAATASGALLIALDSQLTFIADDWELLVAREGWSPDVFLDPFHENIVVGPAFVYKSLLAVFGMGSALPFYVVSISLFLTSAVLLFVYLRSRVGDWLALICACSILFLGAAFEDFLWAFQIGYSGSMAAGLGMLVTLDRRDDLGDGIACALLAISLIFSSLGIVFFAAALVDLALGRRPWERRLYLVLLPLSLFLLWLVGWGHEADSHLSVDNLRGLAGYVFDSAAAGIVSLLGLATGDGSEPDQPHLIWGQILVPVVFALVGLRVLRDRGVSRGLAVVLVLALAFWVLAGLNRSPERFPTSSRYQYPSAVFLLLIAGEALRGLRVPRLAVVAAAAVAVAAAVGGISLLDREHEERWQPAADSIRSSLAAIDLAGPAAKPNFPVVFPPNIRVPARTYLAAAREHGSPAFDEAELAVRPAPERAAADLTLAEALGLALVSPRRGERVLRCQTVQAARYGETGVRLRPGRFTVFVRNGGYDLMIKRFADEFSVFFGVFGGRSPGSLSIPADAAKRPWSLGLPGLVGSARFCTLG